jgi:hypothetical protein
LELLQQLLTGSYKIIELSEFEATLAGVQFILKEEQSLSSIILYEPVSSCCNSFDLPPVIHICFMPLLFFKSKLLQQLLTGSYKIIELSEFEATLAGVQFILKEAIIVPPPTPVPPTRIYCSL